MTDYVRITKEASSLSTSASVLWTVAHDTLALMTHCLGSSPFGFGFGFRPKFPLYFRWHIRFRPKVKLPLSVDLYLWCMVLT